MQDTIISCPCCGQKTAVKRPLVNLMDNTIAWRGRITVTGQRAEILDALAKKFGSPVSYERLLAAVHGAGDEPNDAENGLKVQVCGLRKQLPRVGLTIQTVWGKGYVLTSLNREASHAAA